MNERKLPYIYIICIDLMSLGDFFLLKKMQQGDSAD